MPCVPILLEDNQGAVQVANIPTTNKSDSKHIISVRHRFLTELVERKVIAVIQGPPAQQHADFLTESLSVEFIEFHRQNLPTW